MKNIHVLSTDKPSGLYYSGNNSELLLSKHLVSFRTFDRSTQHIYITSDEEIKDGEYGICINLVIEGFNSHQAVFKMDSEQRQAMEDLGGQKKAEVLKIILTTDQDLIKDGVQAIDDEFLEWFIKNPNCEFVEISNDQYKILNSEWKNFYKIIIPKEEPKQKTLTNDTDSHSWGFENFEVIKTEEDAKIFVETMENIPEPNDKLKKAFKNFNKQETLEEAFVRFMEINYSGQLTKGFVLGAMKFASKWQAERMYSEEDMKQFGLYLGDNLKKLRGKTIDEIFEQFKKK